MSIQTTQYADPFIYNLGASDVPGSGSTAKSLRELILALSGGAVPPAPIVAVEIKPLSGQIIRMYGGFIPPIGAVAQGFLAAGAGGGYTTIPDTGALFDLSDPLDYVRFKSDGAGTTGGTIILYTSGQAGH